MWFHMDFWHWFAFVASFLLYLSIPRKMEKTPLGITVFIIAFIIGVVAIYPAVNFYVWGH